MEQIARAVNYSVQGCLYIDTFMEGMNIIMTEI